jgi:hypothetical protein
VNVTLHELEEIGWLAEVSEKEQERLRLVFGNGPQDFRRLARFQFETMCVQDFGLEDEHLANSYAKIVKLYGAHSDGEFTPENIRDKYDVANGVILLAFDFRGQEYRAAIPIEQELFQKDAHILISKALKSHGIEKRFIPIPLHEPFVYMCYNRRGTFERAIDRGIIPAPTLPPDEDA